MEAVRQRTLSAARGGLHSSARCSFSTSSSTARRCCRPFNRRSPASTGPSGLVLQRGGDRRGHRARRQLSHGGLRRRLLHDNERPRHAVELAAFAIGRAPVTNAEFLEFVADGGYHRRALVRDGFAERERAAGAPALLDRRRCRGGASTESKCSSRPCRRCTSRGTRSTPSRAGARRACRPRPSGSGPPECSATCAAPRPARLRPGPAGPFVGDCWEWTATDFGGYPGFSAFRTASTRRSLRQGYKVLRGASWATARAWRARPSATGTTRAPAALRRLPLAWSC